MDVEAYRQRTLAEMEAATPPPPPPDAGALLTELASPQAAPTERLAALHALLRLAFQKSSFAPYRAGFLDVLAAVVTDARAEPELRAEAIEKLVQERQPIATQLLTAGISDPARALVPLAKAVQLLAIDDHGVAAAAAREAIKLTDNSAVWTEAMHALAGDPSATPILQGVLADKSKPAEVRLASAAGLHALDPGRLLAQARGIARRSGRNRRTARGYANGDRSGASSDWAAD